MKYNYNINYIAKLLLVTFVALFSSIAFAQGGEPLKETGDLICAIAKLTTNDIARAVASIATLWLFWEAMLGKIDWIRVLVVAVAFFIMFSIIPILEALAGENMKTQIKACLVSVPYSG
jgi:type IV secretory pathway VirB2 component (pilin)